MKKTKEDEKNVKDSPNEEKNEAAAELSQKAFDELTLEEYHELCEKAAHAEEWKNKYLYQVAELENLRKRVTRERSELIKYAAQSVLYDLLEVMDNFARAIEADKDENDPTVIVQGIEMIYAQLERLLERFNVRPIAASEEAFNPEYHEAIQQIPSPEHTAGTIIEEMQRGYTYHDRVLRPSRVVVAEEPQPEREAEASEDAEQQDAAEEETQ